MEIVVPSHAHPGAYALQMGPGDAKQLPFAEQPAAWENPQMPPPGQLVLSVQGMEVEPDEAVPLAAEPEPPVPLETDPAAALPLAVEPEPAPLETDPAAALPLAADPDAPAPLDTDPDPPLPLVADPDATPLEPVDASRPVVPKVLPPHPRANHPPRDAAQSTQQRRMTYILAPPRCLQRAGAAHDVRVAVWT
jgi:hypothetical protein